MKKLLNVLLFIILLIIPSSISAVRVSINEDHITIYEWDVATFQWQIMNDEESQISVDIEFTETEFDDDVEPNNFDLYPTESETGTYRIGRCGPIEETVTLTLFLTFVCERDGPIRPGRTESNSTLYLTILKRGDTAAVEPPVKVEDEDYPLQNIVYTVGIISVLIYINSRLGYFCFFTPYYYKLMREDLFQHDDRNSILKMIASNKNGTHLKDIFQSLELNRSTTRYHLRKLIEYGVVVKGNDGRYYLWKYRARAGESIEDAIWDVALNNPEIKKAEIARRLGLSRQTVGYHMNKKKRIGEE